MGGGQLHNKGLTVLLTSTTGEITTDEIFVNNQPTIEGYVDMLAVAGNDYKETDETTLDQVPPAYEKNFSAKQSKKKAIRRRKFADTDNNKDDIEIIDYSGNVALFPRSVANGAWNEIDYALAEIESVKNTIPKFYDVYCTSDSAQALKDFLETNSTDSKTLDELATLKTDLQAKIGALKFKYDIDGKVPQIYITTDDGNGKSYGTTLTKGHDYVMAQITCVSPDGEVIANDLSYSSKIKVRGNSSAGGAKKPYNIKFNEKVNLFGFGKAKKWCLLADYYDPSLMRNKIALTLGKKINLESTMDNHRVEVFVDGEYRGLYLLTEKIEADENRVNIDVDNGDFLVELDSVSRTEKGNIYLTTNTGRYFRLREPEDENEVANVKSKLDYIETILASGDWNQIKEVIDLDSMMLYCLLNEYIKTVDFGGLSVYFHYKNGKLYGGSTWDHDLSAGNANLPYYPAFYGSPEKLHASNCHYFAYLKKIPEFDFEMFKKFSAIREHFEEIYKNGGFIDNDLISYSEAINRNNTIWKLTPKWPRNSEGTYEKEITFLKNWLESRDIWLQNYFFNRVYKESDGKYYSYVNGEHQQNAGFIECDEEYYHAQDGGEIQIGDFTVNENSYKTDEYGKILLQSLTPSIFGDETLNTDTGTEKSLSLSVKVSGDYGRGLSKILASSKYSLSWSVDDFSKFGISFDEGILKVNSNATPGTYKITVKVNVVSGNVKNSAEKIITITVNEIKKEEIKTTPITQEAKIEEIKKIPEKTVETKIIENTPTVTPEVTPLTSNINVENPESETKIESEASKIINIDANGKMTIIDELNENLTLSEIIAKMSPKEISNVQSLTLNEKITDLSGLEKFTNLKEVDAKGCKNLESVSIENCENLEYLDLSESGITILTAKNCKNLTTLKCGSCLITEINLEGCEKLKEIDIKGNSLLKFDAEKFKVLESLDCGGQTRENWNASEGFNFEELFTAQIFSSSYTNKITNLKAWDVSGNQILVNYDETNGDVKFPETPTKFSYEYLTGFNNAKMDVTIFSSSTGTSQTEITSESEADNNSNLESTGGGCKIEFSTMILMMLFTFFIMLKYLHYE